MATDDHGLGKTNLDQRDNSEGGQLDGWMSLMTEEYEEKSNSVENLEETNSCEVQIMEEDLINKPTKREREVDEAGWTTVEKRSKRQKQIKREVFIWSKEKLPKQFAIAKLFNSLGLTDILRVKYINPYKLKIEASTEECEGKLLDCQEFQEKGWRVYSVKEVNVSYGIIRNVDLELSDEDALNVIKCPNNTQILSLKRLKRRDEEGKFVPSEVAQIGFSGSHLPAFIYVDCLRVKVEPFVFPVTQCSNCWKFGHSKARCTSKTPTCPKCTRDHINCEATIFKCVNCRGDHMALNRNCPAFSREKRLRELMAEFNCTYQVACNMYVRPQSTTSPQTVMGSEKPKINTNNSFSGLLSEELRQNNKYTPSTSQFPPLFSQNRPKSPQTNNNCKKSHSEGTSKSQWQRCESPVRIPTQTTGTNDIGDSVNNARQVHFDELIARLKDIIYMRNLSIKEKFDNVIKCCIEWLVLVVVDSMSGWPILNKCLEFFLGSSYGS